MTWILLAVGIVATPIVALLLLVLVELRAVRAELRNLHVFTHMTGATVGHEVRGVGRLVRERTPS